ncbi:MAG TPA: DinB family protein [Anaerolineales bacterium]|nr:DinB family protein [Anaerolineales bacterium]
MSANSAASGSTLTDSPGRMIDLHAMVFMVALAASLAAEGQLNNAKLLRAVIDSQLTRAARSLNLPSDRPALLDATGQALAFLAELDLPPELRSALMHSQVTLAEGRLTAYRDIPDPYVCRTCGSLVLQLPASCAGCGAHPDTFKRIRSTYWIDAFDPFEALERLRSTPALLASALESARLDSALHPSSPQAEPAEGWTLSQAFSHLNDSQAVLDYRINLILEQDNPVLEAKALYEQAASASATAGELFAAYRASRARTIARLESLPLKDWWRRGRHQEFGELTLTQQVSYFACHELDHLPQLLRLAGM